jgi:hypothetical protein
MPTAITRLGGRHAAIAAVGAEARVCSSMRAVPISRSTWFRDSWSRILADDRHATGAPEQVTSMAIWFLTR